MIKILPSAARGKTDFPGLVSMHSFSFGDYRDDERIQFRALRVINDDILAPGFGFPLHPHRNMEIVTYVTEGAIEHQDSMGNRATIETGELQRMTAGSGVRHSEYNASKTARATLLQIWIMPTQSGLQPGYEQKKVAASAQGLTLVVSPGREENTLFINQDTRIYVGRIAKGEQHPLQLDSNRYGWVQLISGTLSIDSATMYAGDGAEISEAANPTIQAASDCHFLFFDLN
jgi:redox-sensitive bicupin YhaK (pirin superfamily)